MNARMSAPAVVPGGTAPPSPQPMTEATRSAAALAVLPMAVAAPFVAVLAAVPTPDAGPSTTMAGGPALLTRRGAPGIRTS
jgi:hypothetical protein